ncbi:lamin tail domain-containing protein [Niallia sp.]|uniref:lamin tail domain-containing protein n=1 Tax=Niallia sp. TaxID=2837523 RepID=UPI00289CAEBC|nr:lamin tail domain-containing protein [Niallia sp.]
MKDNSRKRLFSIFLIFLLVFSNFFSTLTGKAASENTKAKDLFISEYIEGTSNNKAIELFNGTGKDVDLSSYSVELYSNGKTTTTSALRLEGKLNDGELFVIAHPSANDTIKEHANITNGGVANFNGDDAIVLKYNDEIIDVFGKVGVQQE